MDIVITGITWKNTALKPQTVTIKYRDTSLADIPANYITVASNVVVDVNGEINPDITISGLAAGTYAVYVINECSGRGVRKDVTLADQTVYIWIEDAYICEKDSVFTQIGQVTGLSSPGPLMYDATTSKVYGIDLDNINGNFFSYDPTNFTSASQVTYYPALIPPGGQNFMYGAVTSSKNRKLFASGKDSDGLQIFDIATNTVSVIPWGCNHNVGTICGDPIIRNGYPRASLTIIEDDVIGIDKYSGQILIADAVTSTAKTGFPKLVSTIPSYIACFKSAPIITKVENEYWVVNNQGNTQEDPDKSPNIYVYNTDLTQLITTIDISAHSNTWSYGAYSRSTYYDNVNKKFYIVDMGKNTLMVIEADPASPNYRQLIYFRVYNMRENKTHMALGFVVDPTNNDLFLTNVFANETADPSGIPIAYKLNRSTFEPINVYPDISFSNLARIGSSNELHGANMGVPGWATGATWNTDGKITKFSK